MSNILRGMGVDEIRILVSPTWRIGKPAEPAIELTPEMVAAGVAALEACEQGKDCLYEQAQSDRSLLR
jgi:hypothetical protein